MSWCDDCDQSSDVIQLLGHLIVAHQEWMVGTGSSLRVHVPSGLLTCLLETPNSGLFSVKGSYSSLYSYSTKQPPTVT